MTKLMVILCWSALIMLVPAAVVVTTTMAFELMAQGHDAAAFLFGFGAVSLLAFGYTLAMTIDELEADFK